MKTMPITQFKTFALRILDQVAKSKEGIVITKRGKPIAQIIPFKGTGTKPKPGILADAFVFEKDIVSPLDDELWDACK